MAGLSLLLVRDLPLKNRTSTMACPIQKSKLKPMIPAAIARNKATQVPYMSLDRRPIAVAYDSSPLAELRMFMNMLEADESM
jgi:hypothetical protein